MGADGPLSQCDLIFSHNCVSGVLAPRLSQLYCDGAAALHAPNCWRLPESVSICVGSCVFATLYGASLWLSAALPGGPSTGKDAILATTVGMLYVDSTVEDQPGSAQWSSGAWVTVPLSAGLTRALTISLTQLLLGLLQCLACATLVSRCMGSPCGRLQPLQVSWWTLTSRSQTTTLFGGTSLLENCMHGAVAWAMQPWIPPQPQPPVPSSPPFSPPALSLP